MELPRLEGPQKFIWPKFSSEREPQWDCLATWLVSNSKPSVMGTIFLVRLFHWVIILTVKISFFISRWYNTTCTHCFLSFPCVSLWRKSLSPPCVCPLGTGIPWWDPRKSSPWMEDLTPSAFPHGAGSPALWSSLQPSFEPSPVCFSFLKCSNRNWTQQFRCNLTNPEWNDHISIAASNAPVAAAQGPVWFCCCSHALLTHAQLLLCTRTLQQGWSPATSDPNLYWALQ